MAIMNLKKFMEDNLIQKETRVKLVNLAIAKSFSEIEKEINDCLENEQADDVIIMKDASLLIIQYSRYQQYTLDGDGYIATGIFHTKDMYDAINAKGLFSAMI